MADILWRNALTGGGDALDGVASAGLTTGDVALVVVDGAFFIYKYDSTDNTAEALPMVIEPDDGGGAWTLEPAGLPLLTADPTTPQTGHFWARSDTDQLCVKTATGTLRFSAFQFDAD